MARRPLPRILSSGSARSPASRGSGPDRRRQRHRRPPPADHDQPRSAPPGRGRAAQVGGDPQGPRGPLLFLVASTVLVVALMPVRPAARRRSRVMAAAAWQGRDRAPRSRKAPTRPRPHRLQSLYEALVPYFSIARATPAPLYAHGGDWEQTFPAYAFDDDRPRPAPEVRYPAYFTDGEPDSRARDRAAAARQVGPRPRIPLRLGRGGEPPHGHRPAAPAHRHRRPALRHRPWRDRARLHRPRRGPAHASRSPTARSARDAPPVVWRTGPRSTEPHLLALGQPGTGTTTLLRSIALQALPHGDVVIVDGSGTGEYALPRRPRRRTGRRVRARRRARHPGMGGARDRAAADRCQPRPPGRASARPTTPAARCGSSSTGPTALAQLAAAEGRPIRRSCSTYRCGTAARRTSRSPSPTSSTPGRPARDRTAHTRARVVLGPAHHRACDGGPRRPPHTTPAPLCPRAAATPGWAPARCSASRSRPPRTRTTRRPARRTGRQCWPAAQAGAEAAGGPPPQPRRAATAAAPRQARGPRAATDVCARRRLRQRTVRGPPRPSVAARSERTSAGGGRERAASALLRHRAAHGEGQAHIALEGTVDTETGPRRHPDAQPFARPASREPERPPVRTHRVIPPRGHANSQSGSCPRSARDQRVPVLARLFPPDGHRLVPAAGLQQPGDRELFHHRRAEVGVGTGGDQRADHVRRGPHPADPHPGPERLAGGADGDDRAAAGSKAHTGGAARPPRSRRARPWSRRRRVPCRPSGPPRPVAGAGPPRPGRRWGCGSRRTT